MESVEPGKRRRLFAFMNSYSQGKSGGDICFIEVAKKINKFDKTVVTSLLGKELCETKGLKADYLITTKEQNFKNVIPTYFKRIIKAFLLKLKIENEDILYSTSDFLPDVLPAFCQKMRNKKVYWIQKIFHLIPSNRLIPHHAQKASFFLIKLFADLIIADNCLLKEDLVRQGFDGDRIEVNYPGIDASYFKSIKAVEDKSSEATFLGRLHPSKGIFDLVEIWKLVCVKKPKAKLAIIGSGNETTKEELKKKIERTKLEHNVNVLDYLESNEAFGIVKSSKVFIFPSHEEGFGIAILEAMACGLPVVAYDLPVYQEVFPKGMIKVEMGNIKKFADEVLNLLDNKKFYNEISEEAINNAASYDWDEVAERECGLMEKVINL